MQRSLSRRAFLIRSAAAAAALHVPNLRAASPPFANNKICAFEKPLVSLSYDALADLYAGLGLAGVEAAVRPGGHVLPERVEDDLPRMIESLKKRGLEMTILTSAIDTLAAPHAEKVLRTAARLGVRRYRMLWFNYDLKKPILPQLEAIRPRLKELAALNRELGLTALYQNHSGPKYVGSALWDSYSLVRDFDPKEIGLAYDIHHATVEGGLNWPVQFNLVRSHIQAVYVKDFVWEDRKVKDVPLGRGKIDPKFFTLLKESKYPGPISLHVEYMDHTSDPVQIGQAFGQDLATLQSFLAKA